MGQEAWTETELFSGMSPSPDFIAELERLGLLVVVGRDTEGRALYSPEARGELEKVLELVELGYQPEDIAAIATRVGLPVRKRRRGKRAPLHLSSLEVARRAEVSPDLLERFVTSGLISPSFFGGEPGALFTLDALRRVERLRDLTLLGVARGDLATWCIALDALDVRRDARDLSEEEAEAIDEALTSLEEHVSKLSITARRWRRLASTFRRRLKKRRPKAQRSRTKRRLRTRTRR